MALKAGRAALAAAAAARIAQSFGRLPTGISLGRTGGMGLRGWLRMEQAPPEKTATKSLRFEKTNWQCNNESDRQFKKSIQSLVGLLKGGWALGWGLYIHIFRFYIFLKTIRCILGTSLDTRAQLGDFL